MCLHAAPRASARFSTTVQKTPVPAATIPRVNPPSFRATVAALALGQLLCWAALYYGFSSFVLPM